MPKDVSPEYAAYLLTREWQAVRREAQTLFGDACMGCTALTGVQLHHIHYPPDVTQTQAPHLMPLCLECHEAVHRQREFYPTTRNPAHCPGKRAEIQAYLRRIVSQRRHHVNREERRIHNIIQARDRGNPRQRYFAAFPAIRQAILEHVAASPQARHPFAPKLADPSLYPDATMKLFGQIIGKDAARAWAQSNVPRFFPDVQTTSISYL